MVLLNGLVIVYIILDSLILSNTDRI